MILILNPASARWDAASNGFRYNGSPSMESTVVMEAASNGFRYNGSPSMESTIVMDAATANLSM